MKYKEGDIVIIKKEKHSGRVMNVDKEQNKYSIKGKYLRYYEYELEPYNPPAEIIEGDKVLAWDNDDDKEDAVKVEFLYKSKEWLNWCAGFNGKDGEALYRDNVEKIVEEEKTYELRLKTKECAYIYDITKEKYDSLLAEISTE